MTSQDTKISSDEFRRVCGHYVTGVGVVTAMVENSPIGFSINSFTSVSLDPLLVSFYAAHTSSTWAQMKHSEFFAVNILSESQHELISVFSKNCRISQVQDIGDHHLIVGEVLGLHAVSDIAPLAYYRGKFVSLAS